MPDAATCILLSLQIFRWLLLVLWTNISLYARNHNRVIPKSVVRTAKTKSKFEKSAVHVNLLTRRHRHHRHISFLANVWLLIPRRSFIKCVTVRTAAAKIDFSSFSRLLEKKKKKRKKKRKKDVKLSIALLERLSSSSWKQNLGVLFLVRIIID